MPKIALDLDFINKVRPGINHVWNQIAYDSIQAFNECGEGRLKSSDALEASIDANYLTTYGYKEIDELLDQAFKDHKYEVVAKFLNKHIRLDVHV